MKKEFLFFFNNILIKAVYRIVINDILIRELKVFLEISNI